MKVMFKPGNDLDKLAKFTTPQQFGKICRALDEVEKQGARLGTATRLDVALNRNSERLIGPRG